MCISVVTITSKLRISSFYIPPRSSYPPIYTASLTDGLVPGHALDVGDANAHYFLWNSNLEEDQHGHVLSIEITESIFAPLYDDTQTRGPFNSLSSDAHLSSPDISSPSIAESFPFSVLDLNYTSPHLSNYLWVTAYSFLQKRQPIISSWLIDGNLWCRVA